MTQAVPLNYGFAGDLKYGRYYRHSGQINVVGIFAGLLVGLIAGAVMAGVYSAAIIFIPFVKLRGIGCVFYGIALGAVPSSLLKRFHVRNLPISLAVVGTVTLVSYYLSWVSWEVIILRNAPLAPSFLKLMMNPATVYRIGNFINQFGTWRIGGADAIAGSTLLGIWILEAGIIFVSALVTVRSMLNKLPFCEKCGQWCKSAKTVRLTAPTDVQILKSKLEAGDFGFVATLPNPTGGQMLTFTQHQCGKCKELNTLSVLSRVIRKDKKGKVTSNKVKTVVNKLLVSAEDLQKLAPVAATTVSAATPAVAAVAPQQHKIAATPPPVRKPLKSPQSL